MSSLRLVLVAIAFLGLALAAPVPGKLFQSRGSPGN
jgi:hypothetical protein